MAFVLVIAFIDYRVQFNELTVVAFPVINDFLYLITDDIRLMRARTVIVVVKVGGGGTGMDVELAHVIKTFFIGISCNY